MTYPRSNRARIAVDRLRRCALFSTMLILIASTVPALAVNLTGPTLAPEVGPLPTAGETQRRYLGPDGELLPFTTDEQVLAFLHTAKVVREKQLDSGINRPLKVTLERDGIRANAIFRTVERSFGGADTGRPDPHRARDSYVFEVAAYKVSRALGLDRVPPVVLREHNGKRGSLQLWVENAITEAALLGSHRAHVRPARRQIQKEAMRVFDQLIFNWDRHQGNSLYDSFDRLWYIDHTRTFKSVQDRKGIEKIAVCDDVLFERLKALDRKEMRKELSPYLDLLQIDAMMRRRDKIVARIEQLIDERGRHAVLYDMEKRTAEPIRSARTRIIEDALRPTLDPSI